MSLILWGRTLVLMMAAGQAYFITNMEPIKFWEFASLILEGLGYQSCFFIFSSFTLKHAPSGCHVGPRIKIPTSFMMPIAHMVELTYWLLGPHGMKIPQLTSSRVRLLSCSRFFDCSKAKDRLGCTPIVSLQEGIKRTIESYSHLRAETQLKREGPSKASILLGSGRVADTLLWKDKKRTLRTVLILVAIYYSFIAPGYTIITALSKLLLFTIILLLIHSILPEKIFRYTVEKIPASSFSLSEEKSQQLALSVASFWNTSINVLKSLCKGNDWTLFLKVVLSRLILSFLGTVSLQSLFIIGIPLVFVMFYVYEKKEQEIDGMVLDALSLGSKLKSDIARKFFASKKND